MLLRGAKETSGTAPVRDIRAGLFGAGAFGRMFAQQSRHLDWMTLVAVCDSQATTARQVASLTAGERVVELQSHNELSSVGEQLARGWVIATTEESLLPKLPLDVIVEATGSPYAAAQHAVQAIAQGKHVVLVTKELDSVIGGVLRSEARERGVNVTLADGDQPRAIAELVSWVRLIGLEVIVAGKATEYDMVLAGGSVTSGNKTIPVGDREAGVLRRFAEGPPEAVVAQRRRALTGLPFRRAGDLCEAVVCMNVTGLRPECPRLHAPVLTLEEIADSLRLRRDGGIIAEPGTFEVVNLLRSLSGFSLAGGVFVLARVDGTVSREMLAAKSHIMSSDGNYVLLTRPFHLLGVEVPQSVRRVTVPGQDPIESGYRPRYDLIARARTDLLPGVVLEGDGAHQITNVIPEISDYRQLFPDSAVPYYIAYGTRLRRRVAAGEVITARDVELDAASELISARRRQDGNCELSA